MHRVVVAKPKAKFDVIDVAEISLEFLQKQVKGYIEYVGFIPTFAQNNIVMYINDEGKLPNDDGSRKFETSMLLVVQSRDNKYYISDEIEGNIVFTGRIGDKEVGLNEKQIQIIKSLFETVAIYNGQPVLVAEI